MQSAPGGRGGWWLGHTAPLPQSSLSSLWLSRCVAPSLLRRSWSPLTPATIMSLISLILFPTCQSRVPTLLVLPLAAEIIPPQLYTRYFQEKYFLKIYVKFKKTQWIDLNLIEDVSCWEIKFKSHASAVFRHSVICSAWSNSRSCIVIWTYELRLIINWSDSCSVMWTSSSQFITLA